MMLRITIQLLLFLASAFFSGSETALFSLSRMDLRKLRRQRHPQAETLHQLLNQPRNLIISVLCGNTFINVAATANMTGILVAIFGSESAAWISTFVMVPLLLLLGEATPKTIAVSNPIAISSNLIARPMGMWVAFVSPLAGLVRNIADRITTSFVGNERLPESILRTDEFTALVEEGVVRGELTATEQSLIHNLLQAGSTEVVEIMTPRTKTLFIDSAQPLTNIVSQFLAFRKERIPVYQGTPDKVIGFLHAERILQIRLDHVDLDSMTLDALLDTSVMVPPTKKIDEMFDYFQNRNVKAACVVNEFGGVDGFITMSDVLGYIFGKLQRSAGSRAYTEDEASKTFRVPGDMKLVEFNALTHFGIDDPRMTTIAGVMFRHLDRLPRIGDQVTVNDISLCVTDVDGLRISQVLATPTNATGNAVLQVKTDVNSTQESIRNGEQR